MGLFAPTAICLIKNAVGMHSSEIGISIPQYLLRYIGRNALYVAKTAYVFFSIIGVFLVFNENNIKNGFVYELLLTIIFIARVTVVLYKGHFFKKAALVFLFIFASIYSINIHIHKNTSWITLVADTKIAWQTDQYPNWRFSG